MAVIYKDYHIKDAPFYAQGGWSVMDYALEIHKP